MKENSDLISDKPAIITESGHSRRKFLALAGIGIVGSTVAISCKNDEPMPPGPGPGPDPDPEAIDLGEGDIGILNYAYALEQLEAAFYTMAVEKMFTGATDVEREGLTAIMKHEVAHREFFKNALGDKAIPALEVNFESIDFDSRDSVLGTAKAFEDLGVSAYNGAGMLIENEAYLVLAGKIVSVEARHAAFIRDLLENGTFANEEVVNSDGLEMSKTPQQVLEVAAGFLTSTITANNLPTS